MMSWVMKIDNARSSSFTETYLILAAIQTLPFMD